jgi:hypothetical protein
MVLARQEPETVRLQSRNHIRNLGDVSTSQRARLQFRLLQMDATGGLYPGISRMPLALRYLEFEIVSVQTRTERDSNSPTVIGSSTYGICKRQYCYEEGPSRGAFSFATNFCHTPVTSKRPELMLRAFRVYCLSCKHFRQSSIWPGAL